MECKAHKGTAPDLVGVHAVVAHDMRGSFGGVGAARTGRRSTFSASEESLAHATLIQIVFDNPFPFVRRGAGHGVGDAKPIHLVSQMLGDMAFLSPVGAKREHGAMVME